MTLERFLTSYHSSHSPRHSVTTVQTTARLRTSSTVCTTTTSPNATPVEWRPPAQPRQQPHRPLSHPQITSNALAGQQGRMMVDVDRTKMLQKAEERQELARRIKAEEDPEAARQALMKLSAKDPHVREHREVKSDGKVRIVLELLTSDEEEDKAVIDERKKDEEEAAKRQRIKDQRRAEKEKAARKKKEEEEEESDEPGKGRDKTPPKAKGIFRPTESDEEREERRRRKSQASRENASPGKKKDRQDGERQRKEGKKSSSSSKKRPTPSTDTEEDQLASNSDGGRQKGGGKDKKKAKVEVKKKKKKPIDERKAYRKAQLKELVDELSDDSDAPKKERKKRRAPTDKETLARHQKYDQKEEGRLEDLLEVEPRKPKNWGNYDDDQKKEWRAEREKLRERNRIVTKDFDNREKTRKAQRESKWMVTHGGAKLPGGYDVSSGEGSSDDDDVGRAGPSQKKQKKARVEEEEDQLEEEEDVKPEVIKYWICKSCTTRNEKELDECEVCTIGNRNDVGVRWSNFKPS